MKAMGINKNDTGHPRERRNGHKAVGVALLFLGLFWFAKKVSWIPVAATGTGIFWPLVTIGAGLFLLLVLNQKRKREA